MNFGVDIIARENVRARDLFLLDIPPSQLHSVKLLTLLLALLGHRLVSDCSSFKSIV